MVIALVDKAAARTIAKTEDFMLMYLSVVKGLRLENELRR
jgi:hypothetical protein